MMFLHHCKQSLSVLRTELKQCWTWMTLRAMPRRFSARSALTTWTWKSQRVRLPLMWRKDSSCCWRSNQASATCLRWPASRGRKPKWIRSWSKMKMLNRRFLRGCSKIRARSPRMTLISVRNLQMTCHRWPRSAEACLSRTRSRAESPNWPALKSP